MKMLVVTPISFNSERAGGAEFYILSLLKNLTMKTRIEATVLTSGSNDEGSKTREPKINVVYVSSSVFSYPFLLLFYFKRYLKGADLVVENISKFPMIIPAVLSRMSKRPFVAVIHHVHGRTLLVELPIIIALLLLLYEYLALTLYAVLGVPVITVSKASERELRKIGFRYIRVLYPSIGGEPDNDDNSSYQKSSYPLVVYVGRVKRYKRLDHFVKACKYIIEKIPGAVCLIAGKGDRFLETKLRKLASSLGIGSRVKVFVGEISNSTKTKLLKMAWIYLFTSMKEGFGISVVEALSNGTPVVSYDIPALREIIGKHRSGLLVRDGNVKELALQCVNLIQNKELYNFLSARAFECAKSYNRYCQAKNFLNILKSLLEVSRKATQV